MMGCHHISHLDDTRFMARTTSQIVLLFSLNMKKKVNSLLTYFQATKKYNYKIKIWCILDFKYRDNDILDDIFFLILRQQQIRMIPLGYWYNGQNPFFNN